MQQLNKKALYSGTVLLFAIATFVLVNLTSANLLKGIRWDLTQNRIYTLSNGSKEIVKKLSGPVKLRFYFSKKIAQINPYVYSFAIRVQDLLQQYARAGGNKISLEIIDPEPFSVAEDQAVNYGLLGMNIDNVGTELYLGLVGTNEEGQTRVISLLNPNREENLEYDLSQLLHNLSNPTARTVGVISGIPLQFKNGRPWLVMQQIAQNFALKTLDTSITAIPDNLQTLMLVQPQYFGLETLKAIDDFVMRGGHVLAFVDPNSEAIDPKVNEQNLRRENATDFDQLLQAWGIQFAEGKVVADRSLAKSVRLIQDGHERMIRYPFWIDFGKQNLANRDVITTNIERITLATPGSISKLATSNVNFTPLITSSQEATLVDAAKIPEYQRNLSNFMYGYQANGPYVVAARVSGPITSPYQTDKQAMANIVLIADADLLQDHFWVNVKKVMGNDVALPIAANANLVLNVLDNLSGSDDLISIRDRGSFIRPFTTIQNLQLESQKQFQESEQTLQQKLMQTKAKLQELEKQKRSDNSNKLSMQQKQEEEIFRQELVETRRELREVRRKLNVTLEKVESKVKFYSIGFVPLLIIFGCIFIWSIQLRRSWR